MLAALPSGIELAGKEREVAERDGQLRVWWGDTAIDLFLGFHEFHHQLAANARRVPFADTSIPVIVGADLVVCKSMFDRSKDWTDIENIVSDARSDLAHAPQLHRLDQIIAAHQADLDADGTHLEP